MEANCPSDADLLAFVQGRYAAIQWNEVEEHVSSCDKCARRLDELEQEDHFIVQLRRADPASEGPSQSTRVTDEQPTVAPDHSADVASGDRVRYFGEYELLEEIARGGMGVVFKARQVKLNRIVALKMILSGELAGSQEVQRFKTEAEAAAQLDHPGIVPIFEIGEHQGQHYFSMGFVEGESLQDRIRNGPMDPWEAAKVCAKVGAAISYAHQQGVIHRDLKPANVLLDQNDMPKVTDFGLAKQVESEGDLTRTGVVMGTPGYMPPEQASGDTTSVGPPSDVYSLGAILYCLLTGRPPFQAANTLDTLMQVLEREPISPQDLNPQVPRDLNTITLKCLPNHSSMMLGVKWCVLVLNRVIHREQAFVLMHATVRMRAVIND